MARPFGLMSGSRFRRGRHEVLERPDLHPVRANLNGASRSAVGRIPWAVTAVLSCVGPLTFRIVRCRAGLSKRDVRCPHALRANASQNPPLGCGAGTEGPVRSRSRKGHGSRGRSRVAEATRSSSFLDQCLHALREPRGERTAALDLHARSRGGLTAPSRRVLPGCWPPRP